MKKEKSDAYFIILGDDEKAEELIKKIVEEYKISDFDKVIFYADTIKPELFLKELEFLPTFSTKKLVILKNIEFFNKTDWDEIIKYLKHPFPHICLFLIGKSSKISLKEFSPIISKIEKTPEAELFSTIYQLKNLNTKQLIFLFRNYILRREKEFSVIISAIEIFLKNKIINEGKLPPDIEGKLAMLHELDFSMKVGKIAPDSGMEFFLTYLLG